MNRRFLTGIVGWSLIMALLALVSPGPASGAASDVFAVEPAGADGPDGRSFFVYELAPGQVFQDTVAVTNLSDTELRLALYPTDGYTIPRGGGFSPLPEGAEPTSVGSWISLPTDELVIPPATRADITFEIEVPNDASPGDHAGVIIASDLIGGDEETADGVSINVRERIGARIYVRVPGELAPAAEVESIGVDFDRSINPFSGGEATVTARVTNTGNVRLSPDVAIEITGMFGRVLKTIGGESFQDVLPGGSVVVTSDVAGVSPWEPLSARVVVDGGEGVSSTASSSVTRLPVGWFALILLLTIAFGIRRWRAEPKPPVDEPTMVESAR